MEQVEGVVALGMWALEPPSLLFFREHPCFFFVYLVSVVEESRRPHESKVCGCAEIDPQPPSALKPSCISPNS